MSRETHYRIRVAAVVAGLLTGILATSWALAGLIGAPLERPEPVDPTGPSWLDDLLYGGDQ